MSPILIVLSIVIGLAVLTWGADVFVRSASHLAHSFGVSALIIGLTVVAFGTSAPELAVNILAVIQGNPNLAMGNVVGSNIINLALILGSCALIGPLVVDRKLIRVDLPIMLGLTLLLWWMCQSEQITFWQGIVLSLGIVAYLGIQLRSSRHPEEFSTPIELDRTISRGKEAILLLLGLGMLLAGAHLFVDGAISGARLFGWSETLISLTIVAAGTSLPELATSIVATIKGERDIALGNVVGSNIFNILTVLGISSTITKIPVDRTIAAVDVPYLALISAFCVAVVVVQKKVGRVSGFLLLGSYVAYMVLRQS